MSKTMRWESRLRLGTAGLALALLMGGAGCDDDDPPGPGPKDGAIDAPTSDAAKDGASPDAVVSETASPDGGAGDVASSEVGDGGSADGGGETAPPPPDIAYALVRLTATGQVDSTFGSNGIARFPLGSGSGALSNPALYSIAKDAQDRVVLFGVKRAQGRTDADRVVMRLTPAGQIDTTFGTAGEVSHSIGTLNDSIRNGLVEAGGKIVVSGYTAQPTGVGTQTANKIVLLRLLDNGGFDPSFGTAGVVNEAPFVPAMPTTTMWGMAEAYGVAAQSNGGYVTVGYGREAPAGPVDIVAFRFGADGKRDNAWGTGGSTIIDLRIADERGRNLLTLPNDRILIVGSGTPATGNIDALAAILGADGRPDTTFDTDGVQLFSFDRPDEALFGVALSPDKAWAVATGYRAGAVAGVTEDDDATLVILPVAGGAPVAKVVALSETSNDRFWAAAVDAAGKIYGAGFVRDGGDNAMVVARFGADGTLDATFGTGGVTKVNVSAAGTLETARAIVIQNDGRVVIGGVAEAQ